MTKASYKIDHCMSWAFEPATRRQVTFSSPYRDHMTNSMQFVEPTNRRRVKRDDGLTNDFEGLSKMK